MIGISKCNNRNNNKFHILLLTSLFKLKKKLILILPERVKVTEGDLRESDIPAMKDVHLDDIVVVKVPAEDQTDVVDARAGTGNRQKEPQQASYGTTDPLQVSNPVRRCVTGKILQRSGDTHTETPTGLRNVIGSRQQVRYLH